jgi:hypothetical protein
MKVATNTPVLGYRYQSVDVARLPSFLASKRTSRRSLRSEAVSCENGWLKPIRNTMESDWCTRTEALCEMIHHQARPIRPAGHFFGLREILRQPQSLRRAHRRTRTAPPGRAPRSRQVRTGRTSRARSRSRCALTARTANFASTLGRRSSIASVRLLLSLERRRAVTTGNAAHVRCM